MKVILTRDVPKVGKDGEIVLVADGYARNYLFPRQLAVVAKGAAVKEHAKRIEREVAKGVALLSEAQHNAETINGREFQILAKANLRSTRLFGAVTEADVAEAIAKETGVTVDKRKIALIDPIKMTGRYELTARLHPDVTTSFAVDVVTPEQLDTREKLRIAAEEKAIRDAAAAEEKAIRDAAAAEERAAREASAPPRPSAPPRARYSSNLADAPDAEG